MLLVRTSLKESSIHGLGLFADEDIFAGDLIWEFNPFIDRVISRTDFEQLPAVARELLQRHAEYNPNDDSFTLSGDNARFMNHSDSPNTRDEGSKMFSSELIPMGSEITCDYRLVRVFDFIPRES